MYRLAVALFVCVCLTALAHCGEGEGIPAADRARIQALIRQLGDDSFESRRKASEQLLKIGQPAEEAVRKGMADRDVEVSSRCRALLPRMRKARRDARVKAFLSEAPGKEKTSLPGWKQFSSLAGTDKEARTLFARVFGGQPDLLELAEGDPPSARAEFVKRCGDLQLRVVAPGQDATLLDEICALLVVGADSRLKIEAATWNALLDGLETLSERAAPMKELRGSPPARKFFAGFLQKRPAAPERSLAVAQALELREAVGWASAVATEPRNSAAARATALLLLGKLGDRSLLPRLRPLLKDTALVGTRKLGDATLRAELRDVALAACVLLSGEKLDDYGFPYPKAVPGVKAWPSPACLGFATDAQRGGAAKKWQAAAARPGYLPARSK